MTTDDYYCDFILNGRVSVNVVAETDRVLAFHHVFRTWDTHIVIIPKNHVRSLADVEAPDLLAELFQVVIRIIKEQGFDASNYKVITNGRDVRGGTRGARRADWRSDAWRVVLES